MCEELLLRTIRRGDIYYMKNDELTAEGSEQSGTRPAIVVSNDKNNMHSTVVEVVYLTTQRKKRIPTHVEIDCAGIPAIALCEQIASCSKSRLGALVAKITESEVEKINEAIKISLALT